MKGNDLIGMYLERECRTAIYSLPEEEYKKLDRKDIEEIILRDVLNERVLKELARELSFNTYALIVGG